MSVDLKCTALSTADGDLEKAKVIYAWLIEGSDPATTSEKPARRAKPKEDAPAEAVKEAPVETAATAEKPAALDYAKDVQPEVLKAVAVSKENVLAIIQSYGAKHAKDVPVAKWPELVARCQALVKESTNAAA